MYLGGLNMTNFNSFVPTKEFWNSREVPLTSVPTTDDITTNDKGWSVYVIEVTGASSINATVVGALKINDENNQRTTPTYQPVALIDLATLKPVSAITGNGRFAAVVLGLAQFKINVTSLSGAVTICGTQGAY